MKPIQRSTPLRLLLVPDVHTPATDPGSPLSLSLLLSLSSDAMGNFCTQEAGMNVENLPFKLGT